MRNGDELIAKIAICIGAHWPTSFVSEDELTEAVNEFLRLPHYEEFFELLISRKLDLVVHDKYDRDRTSCWLAFKMGEAAPNVQ